MPDVINVYGVITPPSDNAYHNTTYLEYEIPKELEDKLSKLVEKEITKFKRNCSCDNCKQDRKDHPVMNDLSKKSGLKYSTIYFRVKKLGWDIEIATTTPLTTPRAYKKILKKLNK